MAYVGELLLQLLLLVCLALQEGKTEDECPFVDNQPVQLCYGQVGEVITIPCGFGNTEDGNTTFRYFSENQIIANDSMFLRKNLTVSDNEAQISCSSSTSSTTYTTYTLNVTYPPMKLDESRPAASFLEPYDLPCPLQGNPQPSCTWDIFYCAQPDKAFDPGTAVTFTDNNCTLSISILNTAYVDICYRCNATNAFGLNSQFVSEIQFTTCSESRDIVTMPSNGSTTLITVGENITLTCSARGIVQEGYLDWVFNINLAAVTGQLLYPTEGIFSLSLCEQTSDYTLTNASKNNTGNYTCIFRYGGGLSELISTLFIEVVEPENPTKALGMASTVVLSTGQVVNTSQILQITVPLAAMLLLLLVTTVGVVVVIAALLRKHAGKKQIPGREMKIFPLDDEKSETTVFEYDVFLSFADEDREIVEKKLKEPLEDSGYSVCWHHTAFIAGWTILQNMESFIGRSRMVVVFISEPFVNSKFCQHELNIAFQRMKHRNISCILPIILKEDCNIPEELTRITYVCMSDNNFFERLCEAIGEPLKAEETQDKAGPLAQDLHIP